jgi:hypothetical protein
MLSHVNIEPDIVAVVAEPPMVTVYEDPLPVQVPVVFPSTVLLKVRVPSDLNTNVPTFELTQVPTMLDVVVLELELVQLEKAKPTTTKTSTRGTTASFCLFIHVSYVKIWSSICRDMMLYKIM